MPSCVCGGTNENCCWCFGSGYVREGGGAVAFYRHRGRCASRLTRPLKACPVCNVSVRRLKRHLQKAHNVPPVQQPATPLQLEDPPLAPGLSTMPSVPEKSASAGLSIKNCPLCKAQVREDRLQRHVSSRCPFRTRKPTKVEKRAGLLLAASQQISRALRPPSSASPGSLRYKDKAEIEPPPWSNNLDATKNIGYPVREAGRYGSHPSHDAFDDESEP